MMSKKNADGQAQQHEILFQCDHCGRRQILSVILQSNELKGGCMTRMFIERFVFKFYVQEHLDKVYQCPCPQNLSMFLNNDGDEEKNEMDLYENVCSEVDYGVKYSSRNVEDEKKSLVTARRASVINETNESMHRSRYELDFRRDNQENLSKSKIEQNVTGFIDGCVRSSLHDISQNIRESSSKRTYLFSVPIISLTRVS